VLTEATAVCPEGRISPGDSGLWNDAQARAWGRVARFVKSQGAVAGVQLAHAGRKASTAAPWDGGGLVPASRKGWTPVAPSAIAFDAGYATPRELTLAEIGTLPGLFATAAARAAEVGFEAVELHFAHGYLVHEFLSPLSNRRSDAYGGSFDNRVRLALEIAEAVRRVWSGGRPLFVLDLGMPPDVEPGVGRLAGVTLADLTALGRHLAGRATPSQIPRARAIAAAEAAAYTGRQDQAAAAPVIAAMHAQIRQLADAELARLHDRLPDLSEHQRAETAATVHRILRKILHLPTVRAKEFSSGPDGPLYLDALQQLFDLRTAEAKS